MKAYYIHSHRSLVKRTWLPLHIGVEGEKWCNPFSQLTTTMELNTVPFWVSPGKVYVDVEFPLYRTEYFIPIVRRYLYRGCTTLIVQVPIITEKNLQQTFYSHLEQLDGIALDYMAVPRVSLTKLSTSMVLFFGRHKIPFIIVEVTDKKQLLEKEWQWIAQAQHPSFIPIVPVFSFNDSSSFSYKEWLTLMEEHQVRTLPSPITEEPLSLENLKATGIFPTKGEFIYQGDADYNIYPAYEQQEQIEGNEQMFYHKAIPYVTVIRGQVIRAHLELDDYNGYGKYQTISIPNHFTQ
ncbi:hypothetical protein ACFFGV_06065 [Pontibacillus salicampi]|uniref:Uncharacterized protein n=1 Tax=Pontibacillus salicampi TaxID=1449801 RepID=A0ABV6LL69_9BACI